MIKFPGFILNVIFSCKSMELIITYLDSLGTLVHIKYLELFLEDATRGYRESSCYFK